MLFPEEDAPLLKKWIMQRLADTSDADADVLADYVLALLRHDADIESVRQLCLSEIPDFLKEDSAVFVQDVFNAIQFKSYVPGATPLPRLSNLSAPPSGPSVPSYGNLGMGGQLGPLNGARKRSYNDRGEGDFQDRGIQGGDPNGRQYKQPRRGGPGMGRGQYDNSHNGRGGFGGNRPPPASQMPPSGFPNMPPMNSPPPGMPPFDPNSPMATILAMQAMGFPLPGMPQPPVANSPGPGSRGPAGPSNARRKARCRDYDEKGFCGRGSNCHFEHGDHAVWTPPERSRDEYNPNSSSMIGVEGSVPPVPNIQLRGGMRGGRGQGGAGRHDFNNTRKNGRSEFSSDRANQDRNNTTIVVENIPEEKFTEEEVRIFFNEFGNILEVSMRPYKRLAIVKFADWDGANAAYQSPKVIFDNRFVKVYWYINQDSLPRPPPTRTNGTGPPNSSALPLRSSEPQIDIEEFTRKQQDVQKAYEEKMRKKQEMEKARQELEKRQEELLKNQAEEKRRLMERIAAKSGVKAPSPVNAIKQENIPSAEAPQSSTTDALKAQLAALEAEAQSLGIDTTALPDQALDAAARGGYRGRGGFRGRGFVPRGSRGGYRGRGGAPFAGAAGGSVMRLDNRPKTISLTGVDFTGSEKDEALRQYLLGVGDYTSLNATPNLTTITFKERYIAENFMYKTPGCEIPGVGRVEMVWVKSAPPASSTPSSSMDYTSGSAKIELGMKRDADVTMADEEGALSGESGNGLGGENSDGREAGGERERREQNLDYDVADDEWN